MSRTLVFDGNLLFFFIIYQTLAIGYDHTLETFSSFNKEKDKGHAQSWDENDLDYTALYPSSSSPYSLTYSLNVCLSPRQKRQGPSSYVARVRCFVKMRKSSFRYSSFSPA